MIKNKSGDLNSVINLVTALLTVAVNLAVNFFLSPFIVRSLGEEANGFTQLANNFVTYASLITLAFNSMASRFISVEYHKKNYDKTNEYYSAVVVCNIAFIVILAPVAFYVVSNLENIINLGDSEPLDVKWLFGCVFINFFLNLILSLFTMSMYVMNKIYVQNTINFFRNLFNAILLLCAFSILPPKMYYVSSVSVVLSVISLPLYVYFKKRFLPDVKPSSEKFSIRNIGVLFASGIWNSINQCGNMLMTGMDLLLANLFVDPSSMGVLSVAKSIPNTIISLGTILNNSFSAELTIEWAHGNTDRILKSLRRAMKISTVLLSIPIVTFSVFGVAFYTLWQPTLDSKELTILSFLTMSAFIIFSGTQALYNVFTTTNHLTANSVTFLISGIVNIVAVYFCLKYTNLGVYAIAGLSPLVTIIRQLVFVLPYVAHLLKLKWYTFYRDLGLSILIGGVNSAICYLTLLIIKPNSWIILAVAVCISCVFEILFDFIVILNKEEKQMLKNKLRW